MLNLSNREQDQSIANKKDVDEKTSIDLGITGAEVGEVATVAAVDENGKPTAWTAKNATASPTFTGTPTAPTAAAGTNTTQIATTAFVQAALASIVNGNEVSY